MSASSTTESELPTDAYDLSPKVASHMLWRFAEGGVAPGHFLAGLLEAMSRADDENLDRLALAFPAYVAAYRSAALTHGGIARLRAIARAGGWD